MSYWWPALSGVQNRSMTTLGQVTSESGLARQTCRGELPESGPFSCAPLRADAIPRTPQRVSDAFEGCLQGP
jgi:hypothetical protein